MRISGWLYLVQQLLCSLCLLYALGRAAGLSQRHPLRLAATALIAALGCLAAAWSGIGWLRALLIAPLLALAPGAAWPGIPRRLRRQLALWHGLLGLALAGWMRLVVSLGAWQGIVVPLGCGMLCAVTPLLRRAEHPRCVTTEIRFGGRRLTLTALIDSGNLLRDPITQLPVIVISRRAAARLTMLPPPGRIAPGMRLISVRTVAGSALMAVFRPGAVFLEEGGAWRAVNAMVGLSPDGYEGFQALVPAALVGPAAGSVVAPAAVVEGQGQ